MKKIIKVLIKILANTGTILGSLYSFHLLATMMTLHLNPIVTNMHVMLYVYVGLLLGEGWGLFILILLGIGAMITLVNMIIDRVL